MAFSFFLNMRTYGSENFKTQLLLQFWLFLDQTFLNGPDSPQQLPIGILKIQISNF